MTDAPRLALGTRVQPGNLRPKVGPEIAFERVSLELRNEGAASAAEIRLRLRVRQGEETICDAEVLLDQELAPGDRLTWDLYEFLMERGKGFPSKVRLFGIKAALQWDFTVRASAETAGATAEAGFRFRWSGTPTGPIMVSVEELP